VRALDDFIFNVRDAWNLRAHNRAASRVIERYTGYDVSGWRHLDGAMVEWLSRSERWDPPGLTPENGAVVRLLALLDTPPREMVPSLNEGLKRLIQEEQISPELLQALKAHGWPR
jgi:hypothetical protein